MQNQDRYSTFDRVTLAICLIVVLLCTFLMIDGRFLFGGDDTSNLAAVGTIDRSENDVRQKHQTGFTWRGSRGSETVFEGDSIFTGNGSKAKIKFAKGGELEIDAKSLVVIRTNNGKLELNLLYGAFSGNLKADEKIIVLKDGERTELTGPMKIEDHQTKIQPKVTKNIELKSPANNILYWSGETNYTWTGPEGKSSYILEFSSGASFKKKIGAYEVTGNEFSTGINFPIPAKTNKRDIYWRVRSKDDKFSVSEPRKIIVYKDLPPALVAPAQKFTMLIESEKEETKTATFKWIEPTLSQDYTIQIAKDEGFSDVLVSQISTQTEFSTAALTQGEYFWRVQGNHPSRGNAPWSEIRKLFVIEKDKVTAPKVTATDKIYILPFEKVVKTASTAKYETLGVPVTDFPIFKWSPVYGAANYQLEVSKEKSFAHFATQKVAPPKSDFHFTVMKTGLMNWRVRTELINGDTTEPSETSSVRVDLPPPSLNKPELHKDGITTSWSPLLFARFYEVQWDLDDKFISPSSAFSPVANYKVVPTAPVTASLFWRVRALDQNKRPLSEFSTPEPLRIIRRLASDEGADGGLKKPIAREPRVQAAIVSFDSAPVFINFRWSGVKGVQSYRFELSTDPNFVEEPFFTTSVRGTRLLLNQKLPAGQFYWRVRGETTDGRSIAATNEKASWTVWSDPAPFYIQFKMLNNQ